MKARQAEARITESEFFELSQFLKGLPAWLWPPVHAATRRARSAHGNWAIICYSLTQPLEY